MHALRSFIEQQLEENGWTASDLARQSGLSKQHVSKMLNDDRERLVRLPTEETLLGLSQGLRVPLTTVVLRAAQACGVPVDVTEVEVASPRSLTTEQLLAEIRRRIEGGVADAAPTSEAGQAGHNVRRMPTPPTEEDFRMGRAAAQRMSTKPGKPGERRT